MAIPALSPPQLPDLDFEAMTAEELISWTHQFFWPRVCLTCSWQKQSSVLVHMVAELGLRMDTVELDTHLFFRESYDTRDALVDRYQLKLIQPSIPTVAEQHRAEGPNLWERDPDRCCHIRKVEPLVRALQPYDAWISGIRRDQSPSRRRHAEGAVVGAVPGLQDPPARRLGREAGVVVHRRQRDTLQPAARRGVPLDRLHSVHPADDPGRGGARRSLGGLGQARVRHSREHEPRKERMSQHIYAHEHPESETDRGGGFTLWFTGLSGSGKTTIAHHVGPEMDRRGLVVEYLDGDTVRTHLSKGLGFSKEDRDAHVERLGWVASRITRHGGAVIVAAISPYAQARGNARALVEEHGPFIEIHVRTSLDECARRDVNGLYAKAFAGEIKGFTGVDDPYEAPEKAEIVVDTEGLSPEESAAQVIAALEELGLVPAKVTA